MKKIRRKDRKETETDAERQEKNGEKCELLTAASDKGLPWRARGSQINLSVSVSPSSARQLEAERSLGPFWSKPSRVPPFPATTGSHLHYEHQDLLAAEYNADLSVSIQRDREPSSLVVYTSSSWAIDIRGFGRFDSSLLPLFSLSLPLSRDSACFGPGLVSSIGRGIMETESVGRSGFTLATDARLMLVHGSCFSFFGYALAD